MTRSATQTAPEPKAVLSEPVARDDALYVPVLWNRDGPAPQDERDMFFTKEIVTCAH